MKLLQVGGVGNGVRAMGEVVPNSAPLPTSLQHYQKGVIKATSTTCDPRFVNHSVLLVGFGKSKVKGMREETVSPRSHRPCRSTPYWILKNSWGPKWGEEVSQNQWKKGWPGQALSSCWPLRPLTS
jgi:C1A family cysteine protease